MRACIQRVLEASVTVDSDVVGEIGPGLLVLLGVGVDDDESTARQLADKTAQLRIFEDAEGRMNRSVEEVGGGILAVSQFTLYGDCRKGRRPSFVGAAPPDRAESLYECYVQALRERGLAVATGRFRTMMQVRLINDGPVTLLLDTDR